MEGERSHWGMRATGIAFVCMYAATTAYAIYYALTCGPGLCALAGVVPFTPWPQLLEGLLDLELPQVALVLAFLINATIFYLLGFGLARLVSYLRSGEEEHAIY